MDYFVSVIIPTWRDSYVLGHCLKSLLTQNYPQDKYEIILVSQNKLNIRHPQVKSIRVAQGINHAMARNFGVQKARGEIIAFCDDDCVLPKNWLKTGASYFRNRVIDLVGGPVIPPPDASFKNRLGGYLSGSRFAVGFAASYYRPTSPDKEAGGSDLILANTFVRKKAFTSCGGFSADQVPCEESLLCYKMKQKGYCLVYSPKVTCYHLAKPVFIPWAQKVFFYATGRGQLMARVPATFHIQYLIPSLFTLAIPILIVSSLYSIIPYQILIIFTSCYLTLSLVNSANIFFRYERNPVILIAAPLATLMVHIAYGMGFIYGYFRYLLGIHSAVKMPNKA